MTRNRGLTLFLLSVCMVFMLVLTGCGEEKSGNTIDEPEITADYLTEDYAQQLITDGAQTVLGTVTIEKNDETSYDVHVIEKEVVPSSDYDDGYYIADTNVEKDASLGFDARIVCVHEEQPIISTADGFIENHPEGSDYLYTVYLMGDSAELILVTEPESTIVFDGEEEN